MTPISNLQQAGTQPFVSVSLALALAQGIVLRLDTFWLGSQVGIHCMSAWHINLHQSGTAWSAAAMASAEGSCASTPMTSTLNPRLAISWSPPFTSVRTAGVLDGRYRPTRHFNFFCKPPSSKDPPPEQHRPRRQTSLPLTSPPSSAQLL